MIILGIDPGYATLGYGIIDFKNYRFSPKNYGAIITKPDKTFGERILKIYDELMNLLCSDKIEAVAIEKLYFQNNQKTAIYVAQARGVILLAAQKAKIPIYEYTPLQVKMALTGYGQATKSQIMAMTKRILNLNEIPKPDDTADALAIAICHAHASGISSRIRPCLKK
jgi:crossover junction endodeoxyribonuclease RuvC